MKTFKLFVILFLPVLLLAGGKGTNEKIVVAFKLSNLNVNVDGKLTEPIWQQPTINEFTQRDPNEGTPASENTEVWVAYDDANIYIAARLYDTKAESIDASLARRDAFVDSDWFHFFVDPYNDKKSGYYFGVNAGGTLSDGILFNDSWDDNVWDGIWRAQTSIDERGWTVEMQIPFSQLRFNESDKMTWGVNFKRVIKRKNESSYYVMVPKKESGFVSRFARLEGLDGVKPKQRLEATPYLVQKAQYLVHDANDPFYKSNQYKTALGADLKIGIGSNLNLDVTINPDFGQVEVDPAVINLSAFESYFNEKRPFFIEGFDLFYFGIGGTNNNWGFNFGWPELFYSRRIGRSPHGSISDADYVDYPTETRILGAAKLTGKLDESTSIAALSAVTERTYATLFYNGTKTSEEVEPLTHYGVLRGRREFNGGDQALGFMFTSVNRDLNNNILKNQLADNNFTFGLDGWTFLDEEKDYVIAAAFFGSYSHGTKEYIQQLQKSPLRYYQRPDATYAVFDPERTSLSGYYGRIMLNKQQGNFYINSAIGLASPGLDNNDLGFQFAADRINAHTVLGYRWFEPEGILRSKHVYGAYARSYDFEGNTISNFLWFRSGATFTNYYGITIGGNYTFESMNKTLTRGGPLVVQPSEWNLWIFANSDSREKIVLETNALYAKDKLGGVFIDSYLGIEWRPNSQINFSIGPAYSNNDEFRQWVGNFEDQTAMNTYNTRYVFARIKQHTLSANIRLNWTFSPTLSLQLFMQPFFAVGNYEGFKELAAPRTTDFNKYGENGSTITYDSNNNEYTVDPDGSGNAEAFSFYNPDFNYKSLRGTAVLRWEILPGSIFYFVLSHNQANFDDPGSFSFGRDFKNLWNTEGDDILMVKFSYWLDM